MKILGFDGWTEGIHNYKRLLKSFNNNNIELILIHLGSWGNEMGRPKEEIIEEILVRDISYYETMDFDMILEAESPDAILFLSIDAFAHRAFNRYCKERHIPTILLNHGIISVVDTTDSKQFKSTFSGKINFFRNHLHKQLKFFLPSYTTALWKTHASINEWGRFIFDIATRFLGGIGKYSMVASLDSKTTINFVYTEADFEYSKYKYRFKEDELFAVGNPDLTRFGMQVEQLGICMRNPIESDKVVYIDSANFEYGVIFNSKDDFIEHMIETKKALEEQGKVLFFKPHPSGIKHNILQPLEAEGIKICNNENFVDTLLNSCACISETSTAALIPALLGLPLFLTKYGKYNEQEFGKLLTSYPRSVHLSNINSFDSELNAEKLRLNIPFAQNWIDKNAGPLPADKFSERVTNIINQLVLK
jgi:hypothetical protein